jgi:FO synthase
MTTVSMLPLSDDDALRLADASVDQLPALLVAASAKRDAAWGRVATFSPKVFLPLTNICRNRCDYCSFRRSPGDEGAWTMSHAEVLSALDRAAEQGCVEALFCLGDKPEGAFRQYREELAAIGHDGTVDYLHWAAERALERGLLPHTNAGVLSTADMERLRPVNASLGIMLENISERLCEPGMPHHRAPDKRPAVRMRMMREAGALKIPFTTGILIGIGETRRERVESLLAIRDLHRAHGHIQEVIVQNFTPRPGVPMAEHTEPADDEMAHAVAMARLILDAEISVQSPPNLNPTRTALLLAAGINDFGGISPVTPDYINPRHPWPHLDGLYEACEREGFTLRPRAPIYDRYVTPAFLDARLDAPVEAARARLAKVGKPSELRADTSHGAQPFIPLITRKSAASAAP